MNIEEQSQECTKTHAIANAEETRDNGLQTLCNEKRNETNENVDNQLENASNGVDFSSIMTEELLKSIDKELDAMNSASSDAKSPEEMDTSKNVLNVTVDERDKAFCDDDAINALNLEIQKSLDFINDLSHYVYTDVTIDKDLYTLYNSKR